MNRPLRRDVLEENRGYLEAMNAHVNSGKPWMVNVEVTNRCNLSCGHCYLVEGRIEKSGRAELSPEEMASALDQMRDLGIFLITFTGGEFFVHQHAFRYLDEATARGFAIRIFSGLAFLPADQLDRLLDTNVFQVETSIHGADEETHDRFTRRPGSFDRMIASVRELRRLGISVTMKTCWTKYNWRQYGAILDLVASLDAGFRGTCFIQPRNDGGKENLEVRMNNEELHALMYAIHKYHGTSAEEIRRLSEVKGIEPQGHTCGAARMSFHLNPYGDVFACVDLQIPAGSLREKALEDIWFNSDVLKSIRKVTFADFSEQDRLEDDPEILSCSKCMGANLREKGDILCVSEEAKRLATVMGRARAQYLADLESGALAGADPAPKAVP